MSISITGRNLQGEIVTEVISDEMLQDSFVTGLAIYTREKYASIGVDIDEELRKMMGKKSVWRRFKRMCIRTYNIAIWHIRRIVGLPPKTESLW